MDVTFQIIIISISTQNRIVPYRLQMKIRRHQWEVSARVTKRGQDRHKVSYVWNQKEWKLWETTLGEKLLPHQQGLLLHLIPTTEYKGEINPNSAVDVDSLFVFEGFALSSLQKLRLFLSSV